MAAHARSAPRVPPGEQPLDPDPTRQRRHFLLRRLHSLTGVVPLGGFLVLHLWTNAKALSGATCFAQDVDTINRLPGLLFLEVFGILLPLAFHALYGVLLAFEARPNVGAYGWGRNWLYTLQRFTGLVALVFLVVHLMDFRVAKALGGMDHPAFFSELGELLGVKWRALLYLFGTTASVFHFANGLRTILFGFGVTVSERSQRAASWASAALGLGLWFLGANTVLFFATGGGTLAPTRLFRGESGRDACEGTITPLAPPAKPAGSATPPSPPPPH